MNFVNNYSEQLQLAQGETQLAVTLPNGRYRLTASDSLGSAATRWECIDAVVVNGVATLSRGAEGTDDQDWEEGSWIYCSITAGLLTEVFQQLQGLRDRVAVLETALPANTLQVTVGDALAFGGYTGYDSLSDPYQVTPLGALVPSTLQVGNLGAVIPLVVIVGEWDGTYEFSMMLSGDARPLMAQVVSLEVEGIGTLALADANKDWYAGATPMAGYWWTVPSADWPAGAVRRITFNLASS